MLSLRDTLADISPPRQHLTQSPLQMARRDGTSDHTVPSGTVLPGDAIPGTSCQATIVLSQRGLSDMMYSSFYSFYGHLCLQPEGGGRQSKSMLG